MTKASAAKKELVTSFDRLRFGTAGIPISTEKHSTIEGIKKVRELGLESMELEFVRGINIRPEVAPEVGAESRRQDVALSIHAPYYINLNSREKKKQLDSEERILNSARIGSLANVSSVVFHAAYYMGSDKEHTYNIVKDSIKGMAKKLQDEGVAVWLRPELTGKETQFGDLKELIRLSQDIEGVLPCIDFAHYYARYIGKKNQKKDFSDALAAIEEGLGKDALNNMHIHMSGIEHGEKGERRHLFLDDSGFNYKAAMQAWKDFNIKGIVVCESPSIEKDALLMQKAYKTI